MSPKQDQLGPQRPEFIAKLREDARFLKNWVDKPLITGAIYPSGKVLSAKLAQNIPLSGTAPIVELGPGTGPVTEALLARGIAPERLILIEYSPDFCAALTKKHPKLRVIQGDAYDIRATLAAQGITRIAAVVSSLPLLTRPEAQRLQLLRDAFALMDEDGVFTQFTYGLTSPMPLDIARESSNGLHAHVSDIIWNNLPPARVWTYRVAEDHVTTRDRERPLFKSMRHRAEHWREDRHIKPALALIKRLGDHFDGRKPH